MEKCSKFTKRIAAAFLAVVMVVSLIPTVAVKAEKKLGVSGIDWDNFNWTPLTSGDGNFPSEAGSGYTSFRVTGPNAVFYVRLEPGHYYFKMDDKAELALNHSSNYGTFTVNSTLKPDAYGTPYYSYLELKNGVLYFIEGSCSLNNCQILCANCWYSVSKYGPGYEHFTISRLQKNLYLITTAAGGKTTFSDWNNGTNKGEADNTTGTADSFYYLGDTASASYPYEVIWAKDGDASSHINTTTKSALDKIDACPNLSDEQKKVLKDAANRVADVVRAIDQTETSGTEHDRIYTLLEKVDALADLADAVDKENAAVDKLTNMTPEEKAAIKKTIADEAAKAADEIEKAQSDSQKIADALEHGKINLDSIVPKAEVEKAANDAKKTIDNLADLDDADKKAAKDEIDKALENAKKAIDSTTVKKGKETAKDNALKDIAAKEESAKKLNQDKEEIRKAAEEAAKKEAEDAAKKQSDAEKFIKDLLTDENGKIIDKINETTIIKIIESIEHWNTLDKETKEIINNILKEYTGKTYEEMLKETEKYAEKVDKKLNDDLDSGTLVAQITKTTTKKTTLKWKKVKGADGYYIYASLCNTKNEKKHKLKKVKEVKNGKTTTCTVKGRKKNKWYKYRVVAYKKINGKKRTIAQSLVLHAVNAGKDYKFATPTKVKVSKATIKLKVKKTAKIKATMVMPKGKKYKVHTDYTFRYIVTDKKVATVSKKGKITAKKAGTCYIYVCAQNGVYKRIKVTVSKK